MSAAVDASQAPMPTLYPSIDAVPARAWAGLVAPERGFLGRDYLGALEAAAPARLGFRYALLDGAGAAVALAAMQTVDVSARECVPTLLEARPGERGWQRCLRRAAALTLGSRRVRVLLCGNVFAGGEPGLAWRASVEDCLRAFQHADAAMRRQGAQGAGERRARVFVFKDVGEALLPAARQALAPLGYREVPADPVMVLPLDPRWRRFDDYLGALRARYRGHVRQALQASTGVERRALAAADIAAAGARIDELHAAVVARASVRPSWMAARGFAALKARLGDRFNFIGYYKDGALVGFNTRFRFGEEMESHYCGLDYRVSKRYALYRSMLYDDIAAAIETGARRLSFGRTSQEIKSSLGALPRPMSWFGRTSFPLATAVMARLTARLTPPWVAHQPFRAGG
jgi:hypothetical protein